MKQGDEMKRAVLYARVSTPDQHLETQLYDLRKLAAQRGFEVVREYCDRGISGSKAKRPGLEAMMTDARHDYLQEQIEARGWRIAFSKQVGFEVEDVLTLDFFEVGLLAGHQEMLDSETVAEISLLGLLLPSAFDVLDGFVSEQLAVDGLRRDDLDSVQEPGLKNLAFSIRFQHVCPGWDAGALAPRAIPQVERRGVLVGNRGAVAGILDRDKGVSRLLI